MKPPEGKTTKSEKGPDILCARCQIQNNVIVEVIVTTIIY